MKEYKINNKIFRLDLFENIRDETDAYLIGYLLGDGIYNKPTHKRNARLGISSSDKYIIEFFVNKYSPNSTIKSIIPVNKKRNIITNKKSYSFTFSSKFINTFNKYGILSLKKDRTFHNIPKNLFPSFLLGLFDADGNFSWGFRRDRNRLWAQFKITHQNQRMLIKLQRYIESNYSISTFINPKQGEDCSVLQISSLDNVNKLMNLIYSKNNIIYNISKKESFKKYLSVKD